MTRPHNNSPINIRKPASVRQTLYVRNGVAVPAAFWARSIIAAAVSRSRAGRAALAATLVVEHASLHA